MIPQHPQNITLETETKFDPREIVEMKHDRVLAQEVVLKPKSAILMPAGSVDPRRSELVVVSVGPGRWDHGQFVHPPCKKGDAILVIPGSGIKFPFAGRTYVMFDSSMVIGVKNREICDEMEKEENKLFTQIQNFAAGAAN
jgi:co-chaperonin GroES (HSP10)